MKIELKFTLAMVLGIVVVHGTSAGVRLRREIRLFDQDAVMEQEVLGRTLSHAVDRAFSTSGEVEALELVGQVNEKESHVQIRWVWLDGREGEDAASAWSEADLAALRSGSPVLARPDDRTGARASRFPVQTPGGQLGAIEVSDALTDEKAYLRRTVRNTALTAAVMIATSTALAWGLGRVLIGRRVRRLVEHARRIGRGDLDFRLSGFGSDELGQLSGEMNSMCDRLEAALEGVAAESRARIEAIEQLRHADRLTTVGTLASGVAHQLGTPINVIEGHVQMLREQGEERVTGADEALDAISRQCRRMTDIVRQLLDFSRRGGANGSVADLNEVARETLRLLEPLARRSRVQTELVESEGPLAVAAGFDQLQQVLVNIVVNGLHAMPDGGTLRVRTRLVDAARPGAGRPPSPHLCVEVQDSGVGMDRATADRVFEPFFTTKQVGEGTGLGLSVAYGIVQDHGGWIEVASEPRSGSRFLVYLPAERPR